MIQKRPYNPQGTSILVIDNYDSFVYNLVHYLEELGCSVSVVRNDQLTLDQVAPYDKILLSPGPGIPDEAGILKPIIETYAATKSIFGVCLGLQAIGEVFGGKLHNLDKVYHGIATQATCIDDKAPVFQGISAELIASKYGYSRDDVDKFAYESQMKAAKAEKEGRFTFKIR